MDKLYTCTDISMRYEVPIETVWLWIRKRQLPAMKIGKTYRIKEQDIVDFENMRRTIKN